MKKIGNVYGFINKFIFFTLVASLIFVSVAMINAPTTENAGEMYQRVKGDYVLMVAQCVLGIIAMILPNMLSRRFKIIIPYNMMMVYALFLYAAIYLGEVRSFYYNVPHWDTILHMFSGAMLGALGFSVVSMLNKSQNINVHMSPIFIATFAFCFAVSMGVVWEIYEYSADYIMGTNMQKYRTEQGVEFIGQLALQDTMKDLIVDTIGAFIMSVVGFISIKEKKGWTEKFIIKRNN